MKNYSDKPDLSNMSLEEIEGFISHLGKENTERVKS